MGHCCIFQNNTIKYNVFEQRVRTASYSNNATKYNYELARKEICFAVSYSNNTIKYAYQSRKLYLSVKNTIKYKTAS